MPEETILTRPRTAELLAPAGDFDCVRAAVENGADAVYFGLQVGFNARDRAKNFSWDQLPEVMQLLHRRGLRGYLTLNTLIFPSELPQAEEVVRRVVECGVDAVLIQDLGVVELVRSVCPELEIHASTQMSLTSPQGMLLAERLGVRRVVLPRELSIGEIREIRPQTNLVLEAFVHGALCVAYSGQCLTSESLGGRSANRGQCAQACRLPYELVCDGQDVELSAGVKYLLSPQDLAAYELLPELLDAGVASFKIEGRLKSAEYVANITGHYRQALDAALAERPVRMTADDVEEMELAFSRGFSPGWLRGCDHKRLVPGTSSAKHGVLLGEVTRIAGNRVRVRLQRSVKPGDGVAFEGDREADQQQGGRVYEMFRNNRRVSQAVDSGEIELAFGRNDIDLRRLRVGQLLWKTDDPQLTKRMRNSFSSGDPQRHIPLEIEVSARAGEPLRVSGRTANGWSCQASSDAPLAVATRHPLTQEVLQQQFGRLGGTAYQLQQLTAMIDGQPMVPLSVLGQLRRQIIQQLDAAAIGQEPRALAPQCLRGLRQRNRQQWPAPEGAPAEAEPQLRVLVRTLQQLETALACGIRSLSADFQDIRQYGPAVEAARATGAELFLATPRIQKPGEVGIFRALAARKADGILVRNLGGLSYFTEQGLPVVADYTLNAANDLTVHYLRTQGVQRVTASFDLNREQLLDLAAAVPPQWLEIVAHQHMPMFHMEHCVFCALLSPGTDKTNCGRPCDRHLVQLRDRIGKEHPLSADVGCRNTLYNATPQSAAEAIPGLLAAGVRDFRIDLLDESTDEIRVVIQLYRDLLANRIRGTQVWQRLNAANRVGVTRGTLEERRNPLALL